MADLASRVTRPDGPTPAPAAAAPSLSVSVPASASVASAPTTSGLSSADRPDGTSPGTGKLDGVAEDDALRRPEPEYDVEVTLSHLQNNESTPFYSASTWDDLKLPDHLHRGLLALNFQKPSKIQGKVLPLMLHSEPRNMIAQSQSGTGKTAAFVVAILSRVDFSRPHQPQALVLAPSRELARQIESVVRAIGQFCEGLTIAAAIPGELPRGENVRANVIVGTPGTVMDIIKRRQLNVTELVILVVDEADNMLAQQTLRDHCIRVRTMIPPHVQTLLFSATFPENIMTYAKAYAPNAHTMRLKHSEVVVEGISQMYMDCNTEQEKYDALCKLYGLMTIGQSVIFVKTKESANEIQRRMEADGHRVSVLHSDFQGLNRDELMGAFRSGKTKVLIATNVLARGIDVSSVSMVINYDIPMQGRGDMEPDAETYTHRIGRTGRFGRIGVSISFVYDRKSYESLLKITEMYKIDLVKLSTVDWDDTERRVQEVIKNNRARADFAPNPSGQEPTKPIEPPVVT